MEIYNLIINNSLYKICSLKKQFALQKCCKFHRKHSFFEELCLGSIIYRPHNAKPQSQKITGLNRLIEKTCSLDKILEILMHLENFYKVLASNSGSEYQ